MATLERLLGDVIPNDHSRQADLWPLVRDHFREAAPPARVLDLGCGNGRAVEMFRAYAPEARYFGLDIGDSPEVSARTRADAEFHTFDGVNIPFPDGHFSFVYSNQVLEHVRHPDQLLGEVFRVMAPGSHFIGGVSFLEPYHSYSIFHFSPFGLLRVLTDAGLDVIWMRPGVDGLTLILRKVSGRRFFDRWFNRTSPLNRCISTLARRRTPREINARKLAVAGHIAFLACKPPCDKIRDRAQRAESES